MSGATLQLTMLGDELTPLDPPSFSDSSHTATKTAKEARRYRLGSARRAATSAERPNGSRLGHHRAAEMGIGARKLRLQLAAAKAATRSRARSAIRDESASDSEGEEDDDEDEAAQCPSKRRATWHKIPDEALHRQCVIFFPNGIKPAPSSSTSSSARFTATSPQPGGTRHASSPRTSSYPPTSATRWSRLSRTGSRRVSRTMLRQW